MPHLPISLLSQYKILLANYSISLFTDKDVHIIKNNEQIKELFDMIINYAKSHDSILLNGVQQEGLYEIKTADIIPKVQKVPEENSKDLNLRTLNSDQFVDVMQIKTNIFSTKDHILNLEILCNSLINIIDSVLPDDAFKKRNLKKMIYEKGTCTTKAYMKNTVTL